jgi:hypothetical protein
MGRDGLGADQDLGPVLTGSGTPIDLVGAKCLIYKDLQRIAYAM